MTSLLAGFVNITAGDGLKHGYIDLGDLGFMDLLA